jgi:cytochrome oxidase Cu insertion factor (SCO1/SenC/PrrC family)
MISEGILRGMKRTFFLACFALNGVALAQPPTQPVQSAPATPAVAPMELIGTSAPLFTLPDQNDKPIKLSDAKGKWVVLAFYPADGTMG